MKALVMNDYGSSEVLDLLTVDEPAVGDHDVLVRVHASAVNAGDYFSMAGRPWLVRLMVGIPRPRNYILGWDIAGRVAAVGSAVTRFAVGDAVYGSCKSAFAEYVSVSETKLASKPSTLSFEAAAAVPTAAITALQGLRDAGGLQPGQRVLINGASGGVGSFAVQLGHAFGAAVTGVCSGRNLELVRSLGADTVIDYTTADFTTLGARYDLILDNVGNHRFRDLRRALTPTGRIIPNSGHGGGGYVFKAFLLAPFSKQIGSMYLAQPNREDLDTLSELLEAGRIRPVIDRTYAFEEAGRALDYVGRGHARGKVVIQVA